MIEFLKSHPELVVLFVSALVTAVFKPRTPEEYEAMPKWLADTLRVIAALGIDPVKALSIIFGKKGGPS